MKSCENCGVKLLKGALFCANCGTPTQEPVEIPQPISELFVPEPKADKVNPTPKVQTNPKTQQVFVVTQLPKEYNKVIMNTETQEVYEDLYEYFSMLGNKIEKLEKALL